MLPHTSANARRYLAIVALATGVTSIAWFPGTASAQLSYDRTMFLHGFNSGPGAWTSGNTPARLAQGISLGPNPYATPQTDGTNTVNFQKNQILAILQANHDREVLIGHSMGGLVARATYLYGTVPVAAIVTVATPHEGTFIANNLSLAIAFFADVQRRVDDGYQAMNTLFLGIPELVTGNEHVTFVDLRQAGIGTNEPAIADLRTDSPEIYYLDQYTNDGVPHANVFGTIPHRDAIIRVGLSALGRDTDFPSTEGARDKLKSALKACKAIGYGLIFTSSLARRCSYGDKVLGRVDDRWSLYVNGPSNQNGSFDGIVSNANSTYPGLSLSDPTLNFLAQLSDHNDILSTAAGVQQISAAMTAIGMSRVGGGVAVGPVSVTGPSTVNLCGGSWFGSPAGGTAPYSYTWTARGSTYHTGSSNEFDYSPSSYGSLSIGVTVTDALGHTGTGSKSVTVSSEGGC